VESSLASSFSALSPTQLATFDDILRIILAKALATNHNQSVTSTTTP